MNMSVFYKIVVFLVMLWYLDCIMVCRLYNE